MWIIIKWLLEESNLVASIQLFYAIGLEDRYWAKRLWIASNARHMPVLWANITFFFLWIICSCPFHGSFLMWELQAGAPLGNLYSRLPRVLASADYLNVDHNIDGACLWQGRQDLNPRPIALKATILPTELLPLICHTGSSSFTFRSFVLHTNSTGLLWITR